VSKRFPARLERRFFLPPLVVLLLLLLVQLLGGDMQVFLWLNRFCRLAGDMFWISLTTFGDGLVVCVLVLPFVRRKPELVWAMLLSWLLMTLWVQGLKFLINTPRPLAKLSASDFHLIGALYKSKSFPSGHAATASMFAAVLCLFFRRKWIYAVLILLAAMIGLSRIAMGIHWPTEVLVGFLGGWLLAGLGYHLVMRLHLRGRPVAQVVCGLILFSAAIRMLFVNHSDYVQAFRLQQAIALASLILTLGDLYLGLRKVNRDGQRTRLTGHAGVANDQEIL
jgi:membrane-associated phospholipid phosphatase